MEIQTCSPPPQLLKMTFLGPFREEEGSTPVLQLRTQTYMADPLITQLDVRRALGGLNPRKGTGPDGLFPKVLVMYWLTCASTRVPADTINQYLEWAFVETEIKCLS